MMIRRDPMRDPNRIPEVLEALRKVWEQCPDLRLGQLLVNVAGPHDIFPLEDAQWVRLFEKYDAGNYRKPPHK
jgi:hypothetical protein